MESEEFNFDLTLQEKPVTLSGRKYILREASGEAAIQYRNSQMAGVQMDFSGDKPKPTGARSLGHLETLLVSLCLFDAETNELLPYEKVKALPERVIKPMAKWVKLVSELDSSDKDEKKTDELLKNEQAATDPGSKSASG